MNRYKQTTIILIIIASVFISAVISYSSDFKRSTFQVKNLSCSSCLLKIETRLRTTKAIKGMLANLQNQEITIDHETSYPASKIAELITANGYPAKVASQKVVEPNKVMSFTGSENLSSSCGSGGCGLTTNNCNATRSAWQELYRRYIKKK